MSAMVHRAASPAADVALARPGVRMHVQSTSISSNIEGSCSARTLENCSGMRFPTLAALSIACAGALVTTRAHAEGLRIETQEHGSWAASVAALQVDRDSEGRTLHVHVRDGENGRRLRCGTYTLSLDGNARDAFEL